MQRKKGNYRKQGGVKIIFGELLIALFSGIFLGIFTGLVPGVHINMASMFILTVSPILFAFFSPLAVAVFIIAMAITHTFLDNIPSIYLGAPEPGAALAVLPGHKMLLQGEGYEAVKLMTVGSFFGLLLSAVLIIPSIPLVKAIFPYLQQFMGWILLAVVLAIIFHEQKKIVALALFLLSGTLGVIAFNLPQIDTPLFPMLSGLFGLSTLFLSLNDKVNIPPQKIADKLSLEKKKVFTAIGLSTFCGSLVSLFPGVGAAEASVLGNELTGRRIGDKGFLMLVGGVNTVNMVVSFLTFYALDKPRNGAIVVVKELIKEITFNNLWIFLAVAVVAGCVAMVLTLYLSKKFSHYITKVNYQKLCVGIILLVGLMVLLLSGIYGFILMAVSTAVGLLPPLAGVKRSINMGSLLLPVILMFLL
ncbi:tripartite tricarboxylate transporter permease [Candidatus Woesearchaeota archaeon]|nr:tripartite tricarboxylate transporter permease [Candidatus Woesearchaeota archaeon]